MMQGISLDCAIGGNVGDVLDRGSATREMFLAVPVQSKLKLGCAIRTTWKPYSIVLLG